MKTIQKSTLALLASLLLSTASYATVNCQQTQNVQSFVQRFYVKILDRQPDNAGLDDWTNKLIAHERTGATLAEGFIFSGEYTGKVTNNESYVTTLYKAFFNREPDTEGFNGWVGDLNDGSKDRAQVLHGFLYSGEFKNLSDSYGIQAYDGAPFTSPDLDAFVTGFYQVVLGRTPAPTEVAYWTAKLSTGESTGSDIAHGFVFSGEYNEGSKSDTAFLTTLYQAFFNRAADTDGMNYWLAKIAEGMDRVTLLENFLQSAEFVNLTNSYGILAYPGAPTANTGDNVAPVANAGSDQSIEQGTQVTLDGSLSQDSDGNIACYWWREGSDILGDNKTLTLPTNELSIAPHTTTLTVVDDKGVTKSDSVVLTIEIPTVTTQAPKQTGQIKSYDASGTEVTDGSIKDDGFYQKGIEPSYTRDDANNIVTDHITGLQWQDDANVSTVTKPWLTQTNYDICRGQNGQTQDTSKCTDTSGDTAVTYCSSLSLGGFTDWRLPSIDELMYIADRSKANPAIDTSYFVNGVSIRWSSTSVVGYEYGAWIVSFGSGSVIWYNKSGSYRLRCVRDGQP